MQNTAQNRYWSHLRAWLPGHYRHRTALARGYVLQVSGQECGPNQKLVLYCLMLTGRMSRVWSRRFTVSQPDNKNVPEAAHAIALEILRDMLDEHRDVMKRYGSCVEIENELRDAVEKALEEYAAPAHE